MTPGDYVAATILAGFAMMVLLGGLRWLLRCLLGLALGCAVLLAVGRAGSLPALGAVSELLNDGRITPALTNRAEEIVSNLTPPPADDDAHRGDANATTASQSQPTQSLPQAEESTGDWSKPGT